VPVLKPLARGARRVGPKIPVFSRLVVVRSFETHNPSDRKYTKTHEWIKLEHGIGTVGITEHAAHALGEVVFVELPEVGAEHVAGDSFGAVESVKAASDIYLPVGGTITEVNKELENHPNLVNESPFEKAWITKIKVKSESEMTSLLTAEQYAKVLKEEAEH